MMEFLNTNSGAIQIIFTIGLVLITGFYAWQTKRTVKEMEESRKFDFLPIISINVLAEGYNNIKITIKNIGRGLAQDIRIFIPSKVHPISLGNIAADEQKEAKENVQPSTIFHYPEEQRKLRIEYLDIFGRKVISSAVLVPETMEENHPRKEHLTVAPWQLELPK